MDKRLAIYLGILLVIVLTIFILLISLKIDYYKPLNFEIKNGSIFVHMNREPESIYINVNNHVYEINKWTYLKNNVYILDFNINKDINDKVFCYYTSSRLNYLSYIFKVVFNI